MAPAEAELGHFSNVSKVEFSGLGGLMVWIVVCGVWS